MFIPESKPLNVLLRDFRANRNHIAIVVDEYGGVAGLITIEDVLEQIVGDIEDEYDFDESDDAIIAEDDGKYRVKALTAIGQFNDNFGTRYPDEDFDTIGGLVTDHFGRVPKRGDFDRDRRHALRGASRRRAAGAPVPREPRSEDRGARVPRGERRPDVGLRAGPERGGWHHRAFFSGRFTAMRSLRRPGLRILIALAAGVLHALSFAPWNLPWLQLLALAVLFMLAARTQRARSAAALGFAFGLGWFGVGVSWVYISMHVYGLMPAPLAGLATAAFCAFLRFVSGPGAGGRAAFGSVAVPAADPGVAGDLDSCPNGCEGRSSRAFRGWPAVTHTRTGRSPGSPHCWAFTGSPWPPRCSPVRSRSSHCR